MNAIVKTLVPTTREHYGKYEKLSENVPTSALPLVARDAQTVREAFQKDEHLNTIPLHVWDAYTGWNPRTQTGEPGPWHGLRGLSVAERCCVLKHIALYRVAGLTPSFTDTADA